MTAVIYARYSSDNQREESIEGQIRECTAYAEKNGITIVKHYIDRAISAKTDNSPEFQQMIKDSDKKLFDIVLVWKLDRFARNRYDSARYKTQLKKNGVKLMSATEVISDGPEGIILESVLEGYAEYYSADLSEKVIRGMTENALKGKFSGGAIPFGYTINADRRFEIDPLTAPFVAETFQRYNDGQTMREIRDWLNEKGIKNKRGGPMSFNVIQHMLSNRRYIGELKYRDILIPDAIPPIVSVEIFNEVQEKMLKNKKAPARRKAEDDYLLTTKLFCGHCGALMFGESGTSRTGEVHRYYKCATAKKHKGCKKKTVRKQWLEDLVVNQTMQLVRDDAAMESIIAKVMELQNKESTNIPLYEKQLRDAESGIQNMLNAIQAGILTSSTKERLEQLEETKRELETRIAEEKLAKPKVTEEFIRFWLLRFRKLDMSLKDQRQALVDTFINSIYLYDDKVLITFNYKEGTQTVTFGEATEVASEGNGSDLDCFTALLKDNFNRGCLFCCVAESSREAGGCSTKKHAEPLQALRAFCVLRGSLQLRQLGLQAAVHEGADGLGGAHAVVDDGVHGVDDGHFHLILVAKLQRGGEGVHAFHHHAHFLHGLGGGLALADEDAGTVVAAVHTGGGDDEVADAGQPGKGVDVAAHGYAQAGDLRNAAGDEGGAGVIAVAKAGGDAHAQSDDVLHGTAELHALDVRVGVDPHTGAGKGLLHQLCGLRVRAGGDDGGGQVDGHLLGVGGAGEGHQAEVFRAARLAQLVGQHFRHGQQGIGLYALGHVHEDLPVREIGPGLGGGAAHKHRRHRKQYDVLARAHLFDALGKAQLLRDGHAGQVLVHPGGEKGVDLFGQCRPHRHLVAADAEHPCQRHAPGACAQYADGSFCHSSILRSRCP